MTVKNATANFIAEARRKEHLSQQQLATAMEVSISTVGNWETGVNAPLVKHAPKLASILKLDLQEVLVEISKLGFAAAQKRGAA